MDPETVAENFGEVNPRRVGEISKLEIRDRGWEEGETGKSPMNVQRLLSHSNHAEPIFDLRNPRVARGSDSPSLSFVFSLLDAIAVLEVS